MSERRWPRELLALGALSAVLTLGAGGSALFALSQTLRTAHELGQLTRTQRAHQDADMAHDALRADVIEAREAGSAAPDAEKEEIRRRTAIHAVQMRGDLKALRSPDVPPEFRPALEKLRQPRERYVTLAVQRVQAELRGEQDLIARRAFEKAFDDLVDDQETVTDDLASEASEVERTQADDERTAVAIVVVASAVLLMGWALLISMLWRASQRVFQALTREAEQRTVAEQLRRTLLPKRLPDIPGLRLAARSRPVDSSTRVGGDWYDVIALPSGNVGLVVGDVVGHDIEAASAMGQLRAALRVCAVDEMSPAAVLTRVNRVADLLQMTDLTTCLYAVVNPSTRTVLWSSAGHLNPLAVFATGSGHLLDGDPGPPIGVADDVTYIDRTCRLERGGSLMLYTDGLVERRSASISDNLDRLERMRGAPIDPDKLCDYVLELMLAGDSDVRDDITLLVLQAA
jgi:serine phosphatase RsbU (regulator of sigma subunit)